jgi:hypothetical protein
MATSKRVGEQPVLRVRVTGPGVRSGRITVPDLIKICEQVQGAVNRQAEALEGQQTLRPGPVTARAKVECTLDLLGIRTGSTVLPFAISKTQIPLPEAVTLGTQAVFEVAATVEALEGGTHKRLDPGVLDSLNSLGSIFDRKEITKIEFIVPNRMAKKPPLTAAFTPAVRERVIARIKSPRQKPSSIEGVLEMADFRPGDHKCRITPPIGSPVLCVFDESQESAIQENLRQPVRVSGTATLDPYSGRTESMHIQTVVPIQSFSMGKQEFFLGRSFQELAEMQGAQPIKNVAVLAGAFLESDSLDEMLEEIYRERK